MKFSNCPDRFALLIVRVDDLGYLRSSITLCKSAALRFSNESYIRVLNRLLEEVESTIRLYYLEDESCSK